MFVVNTSGMTVQSGNHEPKLIDFQFVMEALNKSLHFFSITLFFFWKKGVHKFPIFNLMLIKNKIFLLRRVWYSKDGLDKWPWEREQRECKRETLSWSMILLLINFYCVKEVENLGKSKKRSQAFLTDQSWRNDKLHALWCSAWRHNLTLSLSIDG